ncbi:MAG: hypothetical protein JXA22_08840 [Candidatus Thermoplasmatota archaeon]|nr:hypothetical protein [Candidatus Thermoplasmatota archaeon]
MSSSKKTQMLLALLLLAPLLISTAGANRTTSRSGIDDPEISISFPVDDQSVDVRQGSSGQVNFTFWIYCFYPENMPEDEVLEVDIRARAWWWNVTEVPTLLFNKAILSCEARLTITAPVNSSADTVVDLEVWGAWKYRNSGEEGDIEKFNAARITVQPFYDLFMGSNHPIQYADIGNWAEFRFNVTNRSNRDVNITFALEEDSDHLKIVFDDNRTSFRKGETRTLSFRVRQEPSTSRGNTLHVKALMEEDPERTEWDLPLMFYTEPTWRTFFYERTFIRLLVIIIIISIISSGLFLFERSGKEKDGHEEIRENRESERIPRKLDLPGKR